MAFRRLVIWDNRSVMHQANPDYDMNERPYLYRLMPSDLGGTVIAGSPGDFAKFVADDAEKWAKVVKFAGVKAE